MSAYDEIWCDRVTDLYGNDVQGRWEYTVVSENDKEISFFGNDLDMAVISAEELSNNPTLKAAGHSYRVLRRFGTDWMEL